MKRRANYNTIHPERIIPEWPEEIRQRERIGDWEGDTLCGGEGKGGAVTLVDRKSGLICGMGGAFKAGMGDEERDC